MEDEEPESPDLRIFHDIIREYVIFLLFFILMYLSSYGIVSAFRKKKDDFADEEDALVYRISLWMCTFSLSTSWGAAFLLPISLVSNEVLLLYPRSYYVQWLNSSLIQGLWNHVFLFSNLSLFILLPFAYLFTESEGFSGSKKGIMARVYETFVVLFLLGLLLLGMTYLLSTILDYGHSRIERLFNIWNYYLPFLYSCVSFLGVLMLLVCTPVGFARLFTVVGDVVMKPRFLKDINEEYFASVFEENDLKRKLTNLKEGNCRHVQNGVGIVKKHIEEVSQRKVELEKQRQASSLRRNLGYPLAMLLLLTLTGLSALMVAQNMVELLVGMKALPSYSQQFTLGISSLSSLGPFGTAIEVILILYLWMTSVVGFYSLPYFCYLRPHLQHTSTIHIIGNCAVLLILSSALPVLARTVGITNFDLLGDFGRIEWLGNFYIVFFYNLVFGVASALCLTTKFTAAMRHELMTRLKLLGRWKFSRDSADRLSFSLSPTLPYHFKGE